MLNLGALAFLNPWLLVALAALPALWLLLRATPPSPGRLAFPGVRLLLGLEDPEKTPHRTPWWLLLLRMVIASAVILAFADPVLNPRERLAGTGPVVMALDGGWASAPDWEARREAALAELDRAERAGRPVSVHILAAPPPAEFRLDPRSAAEWRGLLEGLSPAPWGPLRAEYAEKFAGIAPPGGIETIHITDGLEHGDKGALDDALADLGALRVIRPARTARAISAPRLEDGRMLVSALRAEIETAEVVLIGVFGHAPGETGADSGERRLASIETLMDEGEMARAVEIDLPLELRNQITRVAMIGEDSAGATALTDESVRRRRVGLAAGGSDEGGLRLISSLHYLRTALESSAELVEGEIETLIGANPDAIFLADIGRLTEPERAALEAWVQAGGLLVRFAGPRLARGADLAAGAALGEGDDPLLPVRLRAGGRSVGGAMAWGAPQRIREFTRESPFFGLKAPREVTVSRQILARLGPDLAERTWATLEDGTPLVTAAPLGAGRVALFHVTANAEWSSLPLSGLFVDMLRRLIAISGGGGAGEAPEPDAPMRQVAALDGFGRIAASPGDLAPAPAARLAEPPGPDAPPGLYAGETARLAYNLFPEPTPPTLASAPPGSAVVETLGGRTERPLAQWLLTLALFLFAADLMIALWLSGHRLRLNRGVGAAALLLALLATPYAEAQSADPERALIAANNTVLAWVVTGDPELDRMSEAGLRGLSRVLAARTAVEPVEPMGVDLEHDELAFFPVIYWPIGEGQPTPSAEASARLNHYMREGGMIVFDTRDAHRSREGSAAGPNARALRRLVGALDLPPLTPIPEGHVLTRTFYLLDRFPGRWTGGAVWLEAPRAAPEVDGESAGQLISDPNDGVSPVIIGAADWAAAWAVSDAGDFLAPVGRDNGFRQREMAFRFGVNLVMYALTGNYKSDQVHVPALLERLGN
ncbi:DUF4159 domain-containing protein [Pikeienuella piscinae]|uniref:DUF4159 domain-containing protein n=1 Tax=Pikeienuella piscinae TaxID=2748098 RepID=A0A7L5BXW9_9RHOB|nr:DUF4159 domain-containing protein [Pikeienuella piscinae]QIE55983.1 DUF4159 domain-containing protein [Pikeienuella piscinae]